jgi:thiamine transport system permease protein
MLGLAASGLWLAAPHGDLLSVFNTAYFWRIVWFSLYQALLSALLAALLGVLIARALFYLRPQGLKFWLDLCAVCFVAPVLLVVLGVVGALGRNGFWPDWLGIDVSIYGLPGILLAHCFLNIPLFIRQSYQQWQRIPQSQWRQAEQLGLGSFARWLYLEWPTLKSSLAANFMLVFLLCFGSFAIVLALGGGPRSTTLEVAIYQALKYDFDPVFALACAAAQLLVATLLAARLLGREQGAARLGTPGQCPAIGLWQRGGLGGILLLAALFFGSVLVGMFSSLSELHVNQIPWQRLAEASLRSVQIAAMSLIMTLLFGAALLGAQLHCWRFSALRALAPMIELCASVMLLAPAMVITTGLFFWFWRQGLTPSSWLLVAWVNALMALPFFLRSLKPSLSHAWQSYAHLEQELGLGLWGRWRWVYGPVMARPLALAMALSLVLSLGDFGVVALLGDVDLITLPLMIYQQLGHYQHAEASFSGLCLLLLCFGIFALLGYLLPRSFHVRA